MHKRHVSVESVSSIGSECSTSSKTTRKELIIQQRRKIKIDLQEDYHIISSLPSSSPCSSSRKQHQFQATNLHTGRLCNLWVCRTDNAKQLRQLQGTYLALKTYNHPNLPKLQSIQYTSDYAMLSCDYCPHSSAKALTYATTDGISELDALWIMKDCLSALVYLHGHGQGHGGISLNNVKCSNSKRFQLFGCNVFKKHSNSNEHVEYNPPEVILNSSDDMDFLKADMWAVGILMFIMLTRSFSFCNSKFIRFDNEGKINANVGYMLQHSKISKISKNGRALLNGLLTVDPTERITAKRALALCKSALAKFSTN